MAPALLVVLVVAAVVLVASGRYVGAIVLAALALPVLAAAALRMRRE
ncbi:MAG: hypothetical protein ACJ8CH_00645 [Microvirga sp.]